MENKLTNTEDSCGGSGKSFMFDVLKYFKRVVTLNGRSKDLTGDRFFMDRVDEHTDVLNIDDAQLYFDFSQFYPCITGNMAVGRKALKTLEVKFETSPKIVFTSNFSPPAQDGSTMRRLLLCVFSDYYHKQIKGGDYLENRSIADDFGYDLYDDNYKDEYWNDDFNFLLDCLQFYLQAVKKGLVLEAPGEKVYKRMLMQQMSDKFYEWAIEFFDKDSIYVNKFIVKDFAFKRYKDSVRDSWTKNKFTKALGAFVEFENEKYVLNPKSLLSKDGRITQKIDGVSKTFIYMQTVGTPLKDYNEDNRIGNSID
jgi:hypothetical protein